MNHNVATMLPLKHHASKFSDMSANEKVSGRAGNIQQRYLTCPTQRFIKRLLILGIPGISTTDFLPLQCLQANFIKHAPLTVLYAKTAQRLTLSKDLI